MLQIIITVFTAEGQQNAIIFQDLHYLPIVVTIRITKYRKNVADCPLQIFY
jgi:hypothetical protein